MAGVNEVVLTGRLAKTPEQKTTRDGVVLVPFTIVSETGRRVQNGWQKVISFIDLAIFGERARKLYPYLVKGREVGVVGRLEKEHWEKDGEKRSGLVVRVEKIHLLGGMPKGGGGGAESAGAVSEEETETPEEWEFLVGEMEPVDAAGLEATGAVP
jgi:single-strand DNA-binding protein